MKTPCLTTLAAALPSTVPFVGPETTERLQGRAFMARLGANESLFGPSPRAIAAMAAAASEAWMYGDPEIHDLKAALAAHHGCGPQNIVVGEGIDGLLGYLVRLMVAEGDPVVTSRGAYPTFNFHVAGYGGQLQTAPYRGDFEDPQALLDLVLQSHAKLLYIANPDNPMGSHHPAAVISDLLAQVPATTLMLLDEAYIEFAPEGTAPQIDPETPNLIRFRTFSKAHGLAGLRVGYAITNASLASSFDKVRNHFGLGRLAQAGALAALQDQAHLARVRGLVEAARLRVNGIARDNGVLALASATNFVSIDLGRDGDFARATLRALTERGIFVRMPGVAPLDRCLRVSLGDETALAAFEAALPLALRAAAG
jgi:histidinol-phosphate aminotransferase